MLDEYKVYKISMYILTSFPYLCIIEKNIKISSTNRKSNYKSSATASREWWEPDARVYNEWTWETWPELW
ncbi:hypothetical protein VER_04745 [Veillonella sp. R32]|nr:hypothetical protein VER_04745 [Veillonella sp. R32]